MSDYHQTRAAEIIKQVKYATLATVTPDGLPWNSHSNMGFYTEQKETMITSIK